MTHGLTAQVFTARKTHWCGMEWAHDRRIKPGDRYVRSVMFPSHDASGYRVPFAMKLCAQCAEVFPSTAGLIAKVAA